MSYNRLKVPVATDADIKDNIINDGEIVFNSKDVSLYTGGDGRKAGRRIITSTDIDTLPVPTYSNEDLKGIKNFLKHWLARDKDLCIVSTGTSITALKDSRTESYMKGRNKEFEAALTPPSIGEYTSIISELWKKLKWEGQSYYRYDSGRFIEGGTFQTDPDPATGWVCDRWDTARTISEVKNIYETVPCRYTSNSALVQFKIDADTWRCNFIYKVYQQKASEGAQKGCTNCVLTVSKTVDGAPEAGLAEVFDGTNWIEVGASGYKFSENNIPQTGTYFSSVNVPDYNSLNDSNIALTNVYTCGNNATQARLKIRFKNRVGLDSTSIEKYVKITATPGTNETFFYWGIETSTHEFILSLINSARASHGPLVGTGSRNLAYFQDSDIWFYKPDLIIAENPIYNGGIGNGPGLEEGKWGTKITDYWKKLTHSFFFSKDNQLSLIKRAEHYGVQPEWLIFDGIFGTSGGIVTKEGGLISSTDSQKNIINALLAYKKAAVSLSGMSNVLTVNSAQYWYDAANSLYYSLFDALSNPAETRTAYPLTRDGTHPSFLGCKVVGRCVGAVFDQYTKNNSIPNHVDLYEGDGIYIQTSNQAVINKMFAGIMRKRTINGKSGWYREFAFKGEGKDGFLTINPDVPEGRVGHYNLQFGSFSELNNYKNSYGYLWIYDTLPLLGYDEKGDPIYLKFQVPPTQPGPYCKLYLDKDVHVFNIDISASALPAGYTNIPVTFINPNPPDFEDPDYIYEFTVNVNSEIAGKPLQWPEEIRWDLGAAPDTSVAGNCCVHFKLIAGVFHGFYKYAPGVGITIVNGTINSYGSGGGSYIEGPGISIDATTKAIGVKTISSQPIKVDSDGYLTVKIDNGLGIDEAGTLIVKYDKGLTRDTLGALLVNIDDSLYFHTDSSSRGALGVNYDNVQPRLIAGENIRISSDGKTISATGGGGTSEKASKTNYGIVKIGDGITVSDGVITPFIHDPTKLYTPEIACVYIEEDNGLCIKVDSNALKVNTETGELSVKLAADADRSGIKEWGDDLGTDGAGLGIDIEAKIFNGVGSLQTDHIILAADHEIISLVTTSAWPDYETVVNLVHTDIEVSPKKLGVPFDPNSLKLLDEGQLSVYCKPFGGISVDTESTLTGLMLDTTASIFGGTASLEEDHEALQEVFQNKQDKLTAGEKIVIDELTSSISSPTFGSIDTTSIAGGTVSLDVAGWTRYEGTCQVLDINSIEDSMLESEIIITFENEAVAYDPKIIFPVGTKYPAAMEFPAYTKGKTYKINIRSQEILVYELAKIAHSN